MISVFDTCVIPPFLQKLYKMVMMPETDALIHWCDEGTAFLVEDRERLAREILPQFFQHGNFSSFQRQLNMYSFKKVEKGVYKFAHPEFRKDDIRQLANIKRNRSSSFTDSRSSARSRRRSRRSPTRTRSASGDLSEDAVGEPSRSSSVVPAVASPRATSTNTSFPATSAPDNWHEQHAQLVAQNALLRDQLKTTRQELANVVVSHNSLLAHVSALTSHVMRLTRVVETHAPEETHAVLASEGVLSPDASPAIPIRGPGSSAPAPVPASRSPSSLVNDGTPPLSRSAAFARNFDLHVEVSESLKGAPDPLGSAGSAGGWSVASPTVTPPMQMAGHFGTRMPSADGVVPQMESEGAGIDLTLNTTMDAMQEAVQDMAITPGVQPNTVFSFDTPTPSSASGNAPSFTPALGAYPASLSGAPHSGALPSGASSVAADDFLSSVLA